MNCDPNEWVDKKRQGWLIVGMADFTCETQEKENIFIVRPSGYLDAENGTKLREQFAAAFQKGLKKFVLNLSKVSVISSPGIAELLELVEIIVYEQGGQLALVGLSELYVDVFHVTGIFQNAKQYPTEEAATQEV